MEKLKNCWLIVDRLLFFEVLFVMLVVPITPLIKEGMYIVYLHILFCRNQIILPKSEQGSNIEA
jgi:hypothetical protein